MNPEEKSKDPLPSYDSMQQCAAQTGIPLGILKAAKRAGCPAFVGSRVVLSLFLPWAFQNKDSLNTTVEQEKLRGMVAENEALERENKKSAELLVEWDSVEKVITELVTLPLQSALDSMPTSLDVRCNPTDPELARGQLFAWKEETKRLLRDKLPKGKTQ